MKLKKFLTFAMVSGVLFTSCNQEDEFNGNGINPEVGETGTISVYLEDLPKSYAQTRATDTDVLTLEFYVFNEDGNRDQVATNGTPENPKPKGYVKYEGTDSEYVFGVEKGEKTVLVAVNMNLGPHENENLSAIRKLMTNVSASPLSIPATGIPMAGEVSNIEVGKEEVKKVNIGVSRLFSKLNMPTESDDFKVNIELTEDTDSITTLLGGTLNGTLEMKITGFIAINGLKKSFAFPNYGAAEDAAWDFNVWTIGDDLDNYTESKYNSEGNLGTVYSGNEFLRNGAVYVYENCPKLRTIDNYVAYDSRSVYAVILEGEFYGSLDPSNTVKRYWRINVSKTDEQKSIYKILRNSIYKIAVNEVKTIGHGTPEDAEDKEKPIPPVNESGLMVSISVVDWNEFEEETDI
ncbi:MAG: fimbria major subunit, partial [Tannerellaceae bacterium]|nr:fimbria major subunit [Tannerellaceae bacterium]